jgi:NAD(P)-dependent dehydrogenase (short-subunit alcohol dehydrogenase family)
VPAICCAAEQIFTATLAEQYGAEGIYVNSVNRGPVETGLMRGLFEHIAQNRGLSVEEVVRAHVESSRELYLSETLTIPGSGIRAATASDRQCFRFESGLEIAHSSLFLGHRFAPAR